MSTQALDLATIIKAFLVLEESYFPKGQKWNPTNAHQETIFSLLETSRDEVEVLRDLNGNAKMNRPMEIEVVSILDKTVKWRDGIGEQTTITKDKTSYPGFKLKSGCYVYLIKGFEEYPLLELETKSGDRLCIMICDDQLEGMNLAQRVFDIIASGRRSHPEYERGIAASVPKVDFNLNPDISFMVGANASKSDGNWVVAKATQKFKFRMNEEGARAVVVTRMTLFGCSIERNPKKKSIIIDRPFLGWFMQSDSTFPMAMFYCDTDSWRESGKLEDL